MKDQLSDDNDIAAIQVLSMGAMRYAGRAVTAAHGGDPPNGTDALAALEHARQTVAAEDRMLAPVADALRDLQMAAIVFTVQHATSEGHGDPAPLQQLEDKLVSLLERHGAARVVIPAHGDAEIAQCLGTRALDYAHQIILAKDNGASIGSDAVERAIANLQGAAITFTVQMAISEAHAPDELHELLRALRQIEKKLVETLTHQHLMKEKP
jgi:hypothetical protein